MSYVKHKHAYIAGIGTLRANSRRLTIPTEKVEALNDYFHSVFFSPADGSTLNSHRQPNAMPNMCLPSLQS